MIITLPTPLACAAFVGAAVLDIVLPVPHYPQEDTEVRITAPIRRAIGGNAVNAACMWAQLAATFSSAKGGVLEQQQQPPRPPPSPYLVCAITDPSVDRDAQFLLDTLSTASVSTAGTLIPVARSGLPTSFIALSPTSRTILHSRLIRELEGGEMMGALSTAMSTSQKSGSSLGWVPCEGRAVSATASTLQHLRTIRQGGVSVGVLTPPPPSPPVLLLSVEMEHVRPGSVVEDLLPLADVCFLSKEFYAGSSVLQAHALARARARPGALLVPPWGAEGAWASTTTSTGRVITVHVPAEAHSGEGAIVDTLGAGDAFIGAFVAYALVQRAAGGGGEAARVHAALCALGCEGHIVEGVEGGEEDVQCVRTLERWLGFACLVATAKCTGEGQTLAEGALERARAWVSACSS